MKTDILNLIDEKQLRISDYTEGYELQQELDYDGSLHELIDGEIDLYYYDLRKWAVDNWQWVEEAIDEGLCEGVTDYHKLIQAGQYVYYSQKASEVIDEIFNEHQEAA